MLTAGLPFVRRGVLKSLANNDVGCSYSSHILAQSDPALLQGVPRTGPMDAIDCQHTFVGIVLMKCEKLFHGTAEGVIAGMPE